MLCFSPSELVQGCYLSLCLLRDSIKTTRTVSGTSSCAVSLAFEVSAAIPWARLPPRSFLGQSLKLKPQLTLFRMLVWPARSRARSQQNVTFIWLLCTWQPHPLFTPPGSVISSTVVPISWPDSSHLTNTIQARLALCQAARFGQAQLSRSMRAPDRTIR